MALPLTVHELTYRYLRFLPPALSDVSMNIAPGSCCALLGPTGAGKTTLLQILSGAMRSQFATGVASGRVFIGDERHEPIPSRVLFPTVGYFMQDASLQVTGIHDSVIEEIAFPLANLGVPRDERITSATEIIARLGLEELSGRSPSTLSGGEMQRVALASILVARPKVLLLDEPANALDGTSQQRLRSILRSLRQSTTILFSDYQLDFALTLADTFIVLERGKVVFHGKRNEFFRSLETFKGALPVESWIDILKASSTSVPRPLKGFLS